MAAAASGSGGRSLRAMLHRTSGGVPGYAMAMAAVAGALAVRDALGDSIAANVPYIQFFPAVMFAAWYGGLGPGIAATAASAVAAMYFLLPPAGLPVAAAGDELSLGLFIAIGLTISWLNHRVRSAEAAARAAAETATTRAERLDAILNTTVDGIIVIDAHGTVESFNRGAEQLFGYPKAEVIGRNVSMLMPSPDHEQHDRYIERYLATGNASIIGTGREVTGRRRDGTLFPIHLSVGEMRISGERKFTGMLHDLTKRATLERALGASEARWQAIVTSAVDGIVVIDSHGRIETFNTAAERLFGYTEAEVIGRNVDSLMPSPYREEHDTYLARYLATGRAKIIGTGREVQGRRKDGTTFPLHLSVGEMTIRGERKFTGILHDLTARVRIESQLREQTALARLGEMAAVIAHEVKNPLAGIRGAIQVIAARMQADATAPILNEIVSRIDSLDQMIKDLLIFARPPRPQLAPTDVVPLVTATASLLGEDPALKDIDVQVDGSAPPVVADANMLRIVFQNLLINGAHAMNGKGRIRVSVEAIDANCQLAFIDGGPGIPEDVREKVFTPFFTTKSRGTGLGLPTAKQLIEAQHGQIAIDCPTAGGTRVVVRLPLGST